MAVERMQLPYVAQEVHDAARAVPYVDRTSICGIDSKLLTVANSENLGSGSISCQDFLTFLWSSSVIRLTHYNLSKCKIRASFNN